MKASNLPEPTVRQVLHWKFFYTKFTIATREFKRIKAFAGFKNENWCKDLAYVDKLSKAKNGVKYLLVRQDVFDRTVDAKRTKTKDSKETVCAFLNMITKTIRPKKIESTVKRILLESLKNFAKLKKYKFTLQWVRLRLHMLNVQYDPRNKYFTVTWKILETSAFRNWLNSLQHWMLERFAW